MKKFQVVNALIVLMTIDESFMFMSKSELSKEIGVHWITDEMVEEAKEWVKTH